MKTIMLHRLIACLTVFAVLGSLVTAAGVAGEPRIALWDPGTSVDGGRFPISTSYLDDVARWLGKAGVAVQRLTAEQVADGATFSADRFDALMLEGNAIPEIDLPAYQRFMAEGGVLIALAAENPFYNKIAQDPQGLWRTHPEKPPYAWQTSVIENALGMQFNYHMDMAYTGSKHTPTPLLEQYLPQAKASLIQRPLLNRWYVATTGKFYPLIRSQQSTGGDYTPQMYVVVNGKNRAIVCANKLFTSDLDPQLWPWGQQTVVAMARLAGDLHGGKVDLSRQLSVALPTEAVLPGPLEIRGAASGIDPEHAQSVVRWGRFDGSRLDLGKPLAAKGLLKLPAGVADDQVPGALQPGASVELGLPDLGPGPLYLRIRGAFAQTGAGLAVRMGDTVLHNELFVYRLSAGIVNMSFHYKGASNEFTRIRYIPPPAAAARTLVLSNPGSETVYFDAIQIERRREAARKMGLGLGNGVTLAYDGPTKLTPEICRDWSYFRCTSRTHWIGAPDTSDCWNRYDRHVERFLALSPHTQIIFEGTPEWEPISLNRYRAAASARPQATPPDTAKYREMVQRIVRKYAGRVDGWEIWNEENVQYFWMGTPQEYAAFFHAIAPAVRELDPKAAVILGGFAGTTSGYVDPFAAELVRAGCTRQADLIGFHPYARNGAWDLPYSLFEGHLMNLGADIEIYCNESGFNLNPDFDSPGGSPAWQADNLGRGMARLLAGGLAKLTVFNAGGDGDSYGLFDKDAKPRPAYEVFADYLPLAQRDGRRLDSVLIRPDGQPIEGVYVAGASHNDGSATLVVNPADVESLIPPEDPSHDFTGKSNPGWTCFFGKARYEKTGVTVTPGEKGYAGFYKRLVLDPRAFPKVEVSMPECAKRWTLTLKFADGENVVVTDGSPAGDFTFSYLDKLKNVQRRDCEVSFRVLGGPASLAHVHFLAGDVARPGFQPLPVRLLVPLARPGNYTAAAHAGRSSRPIELKLQSAGGQYWAQVDLALTGRTVVTLKPADASQSSRGLPMTGAVPVASMAGKSQVISGAQE